MSDNETKDELNFLLLMYLFAGIIIIFVNITHPMVSYIQNDLSYTIDTYNRVTEILDSYPECDLKHREPCNIIPNFFDRWEMAEKINNGETFFKALTCKK